MESFVWREMRRYNSLIGGINAVYHEASVALGVSDSTMMVFYAVCNEGDKCSLKNVRISSGLPKQTVNSCIRNLEKRELVYLRAKDGKSKTVFLTEKGTEFAKKTVVRIIQAENAVFSGWEKRDVETYLALTERFLNDFKEKTSAFTREKPERTEEKI